MAGLLSSLFDTDASANSADSHNAHVPASTLDEGYDDDGTQGAQSFSPSTTNDVNDPNDGGASDVGGPLGAPSGHPEPQSGETDASAF